MRFITTKPLQILFPQIRWKGPADHVYLTFDDGPHPVATPLVLRELSDRGVKATFFLLGSNVERFPELAKQIAAEGHTIGNHTFDHPSLLFKSHRLISDQIDRTQDAIRRHTGLTARYFRPPYGLGGPAMYKTAKKLGHEVVYWDVDSGDHENIASGTIALRSTRSLHPGSIVLFHDNDRTKDRVTDVLRSFFEIAQGRNFTFAPLPV
ncbi:MAG: polysaccharide deacetylase family protein [Bacteroidota bacterium]